MRLFTETLQLLCRPTYVNKQGFVPSYAVALFFSKSAKLKDVKDPAKSLKLPIRVEMNKLYHSKLSSLTTCQNIYSFIVH